MPQSLPINYPRLVCVQIIFCIALLSFNGNVYANTPQVSLFQLGNASALFAGAIDGDMNYRQLKKKGSFGLGTFNGIQGEMVAVDGHFYKIGLKGVTTPVDPNWKTPFVELVHFSPAPAFHLGGVANYAQLKPLLTAKMDNKNVPYALQVKGTFTYLKLRSRSPRIALQKNNPIEETYTAENISGTLVGFWFPDYLFNLTVPGFHFHFISKDKKLSGHVLDLQSANLLVSIDKINKIELQFPQTEIYKKAEISAPTIDTYIKSQM